MAWVRRVRKASGATAVQIAESVDGRRRIVRHVGSARDKAELGLVIAEAQRLLADDAQRGLDLGLTRGLDLGLTPVVPKVALVPAPAQELLGGSLLRDGGCAAHMRLLRVCSTRPWPACTAVSGSTWSAMTSSGTGHRSGGGADQSVRHRPGPGRTGQGLGVALDSEADPAKGTRWRLPRHDRGCVLLTTPPPTATSGLCSTTRRTTSRQRRKMAKATRVIGVERC